MDKEKIGENILQTEFKNTPREKEFTSENFKIEIKGLPDHYSISQFRTFLNKQLKLDCHKIKVLDRHKKAYINFKNEEAKQNALSVLNDYVWLKSKLNAKHAPPAKDPLHQVQVPAKILDVETMRKKITESITPWYNKEYSEQITLKKSASQEIIERFHKYMKKNLLLSQLAKIKMKKWNGLVCELTDVVKSPVIEGYRNKCEFTIGESDGKNIVGFRISSYKGGSVQVGSIYHLSHINERTKNIVREFEKYINCTPYKHYEPFSHAGVWRMLTVRVSNMGDALLIIVINPNELSKEELSSLEKGFVDRFNSEELKSLCISSIYFQFQGQTKEKIPELKLVFGKEYIEEKILDNVFKAGPDSFLQVNTLACEELYKEVGKMIEVNEENVFLDICCGVGTIGLSVANKASLVLGVDNVPTAINYANANADKMELSDKTKYYLGTAEKYLSVMTREAKSYKAIGVLDPPRAGLCQSVIKAIRNCRHLNRLIYVSCDPKAALQNFEGLMCSQSKHYGGDPFIPMKAVPVDLFPHTPHYELIIMFERFDDSMREEIRSANKVNKELISSESTVQENGKRTIEDRDNSSKRCKTESTTEDSSV